MALKEFAFFAKFFSIKSQPLDAGGSENTGILPEESLFDSSMKNFQIWLHNQLDALHDPLSCLLALKLVLALSEHYQPLLTATTASASATDMKIGNFFERFLLQLQFTLKPKCQSLLSNITVHLNNHSVFSLHLSHENSMTVFKVNPDCMKA
jgi:hypothetical protein